MAFPTLTVFGHSGGCGQLRLLNNKIPVDLTYVYKAALELDDNSIISSDLYPWMFDWKTCAKGVLTLRLGERRWWPSAVFYAKLIIYDPRYSHGLYWGTFRIRALENTAKNA